MGVRTGVSSQNQFDSDPIKSKQNWYHNNIKRLFYLNFMVEWIYFVLCVFVTGQPFLSNSSVNSLPNSPWLFFTIRASAPPPTILIVIFCVSTTDHGEWNKENNSNDTVQRHLDAVFWNKSWRIELIFI